jgi:hypothetical protein
MPRKCVVWYLVLALFLIAIVPPAQAGLSPSDLIIGGTARQGDVEKIRMALERRIIESRLQDLGFTVSEIRDRLDQLNDRQIHAIAMKIEELETGGNGGGVVIGILIIVLVIAVILPLLGVRVWR